MNRHIISLPIPNNFKFKLVKNGIETVNELKNYQPTDLIKDFGFSKSEITELYETLDMFKLIKPVSAYDLLKKCEAQQVSSITMLSENFDNVLGGGIHLGKITEVCGAAGLGKTQMCMQLCVNVQIPECFGGLAAKAIYIDTEGSFVSNRLIEIVTGTIQLLQQKFNLDNRSQLTAHNFTVEKILSNIIYYRCVDHVQLIAIINNLKDLIEKKQNIKLIIVDSLAYPFRFADFKDSNSVAMKTNVLNNFMLNAYQLLGKYNLALLVTNQMTTRITRNLSTNVTSSNLVPALGETWAHSSNVRLILSWSNEKRYAWLCKSSFLPEATICYKITNVGLESVLNEESEDDKNDDKVLANHMNIMNQIKRRRLECKNFNN